MYNLLRLEIYLIDTLKKKPCNRSVYKNLLVLTKGNGDKAKGCVCTILFFYNKCVIIVHLNSTALIKMPINYHYCKINNNSVKGIVYLVQVADLQILFGQVIWIF